MKAFEQQLIVSPKDIDERNHVNNVRYVEWVQEVAKADWTLKASAKTQQNFYWVMLSHHIQYKAEAILGDTLILKTYVTKARGVKSTRIVEIYNKSTQKLLTTSETIWCFMSHDTNRPARIPEDIEVLFS